MISFNLNKSKKKFAKDNEGNITNSFYNIAQMNILEHIIFHKFYVENIKYTFAECLKDIWKGIFGSMLFIGNILMVCLFPITFPIVAYFGIRYAKIKRKEWH